MDCWDPPDRYAVVLTRRRRSHGWQRVEGPCAHRQAHDIASMADEGAVARVVPYDERPAGPVHPSRWPTGAGYRRVRGQR